MPAWILKYKIKRCATLEDFDNLCQSLPLRYATGAHALPSALCQIKEEFQELLQILSRKRIRAMLEIGTAYGGTLLFFAQVVEPEAKIISLDLPIMRMPWKIDRVYQQFLKSFFAEFAREKQQTFFVRNDSHLVSSYSEVRSILNGEKLDFLFIDGDHSYEGVKKDFIMYSSLVKESGLVAFHDIVEHPPETGCEVSKFWMRLNKTTNIMKLLRIVVKDGGE